MSKFVLAVESDAEALRDVSIRAFEEDKKRYGAMPPGMGAMEWHLSMIKDGMYYKIELDNEIIGGIKLFNLGNGHYRLGAIFIHPEHQSKGIGTTAIHFIENEYPNITKWSLDTPYLSYENHHFYEKLGYCKTGEFKPEENREFCLFLYEKEVRK